MGVPGEFAISRAAPPATDKILAWLVPPNGPWEILPLVGQQEPPLVVGFPTFVLTVLVV